MNWYSITHDPATCVAHVFLLDDIGCSGKTSGDLARELATLKPARVELQINSSGGCSICGLNLFHIFSRYKTDVTITGRCCSAAVSAAMAGQKITMHAAARILIHSPAHYVYGGTEELLGAALEVEKLKSCVHQLLCDRTGQNATTVFGWLSADTYFRSEAALAVGLVDEIIPAPSAPPARQLQAPAPGPAVAAPAQTESELLFNDWLTAFGRIEVASRAKFTHDLIAWATFNTDEITP